MTLWKLFNSIVLWFPHKSSKRVVQLINILKYFKILILKEPQKWRDLLLFYDVTAESQNP